MKQSPTRVLHYIDTTGPGGAETVYLQTAAGLGARGWQPRMVVVGPGWVLDGVRARDLPFDLVESRRRFDLAFIARLVALVHRHDIGLIHAHLFSPAVYASLVGALTRTPVVATFHGDSDAVPGGRGRRLRYRLIGHSAVTVCVSEALRSRLESLNVLHADKTRLIHNGADLSAFSAVSRAAARSELGIHDDTLLVGSVGNVREAKDYPNLLRAAALLADDRRFAFAVVGERTDPLFSDLLALRMSLGLEERVEFWGFRDDITSVMAAFDILAISSSSEGFSLAAIQAMAAGTPVVATRSGGPEGIITDGVDGLLVEAQDAAALARGIRRLADDATLRQRLSDSARTTVRRRFSLETMLDSYEALYTNLTSTGSGTVEP